jgi:hypothetical protein
VAKGEVIGSLWERDGKWGKYFTGTLDCEKITTDMLKGAKLKIVIFETHPGYRKEKSPTHRIYLDVPKTEEDAF